MVQRPKVGLTFLLSGAENAAPPSARGASVLALSNDLDASPIVSVSAVRLAREP